MIAFEDYAKISNNYCLCYLGRSHEYLVQLMQLMPKILPKLQDINLYLCANDNCMHYIAKHPLTIKFSELPLFKDKLAHVKEIVYYDEHPIESIVNELEITNIAMNIQESNHTNKCVILKNSFYPTRDLNDSQIKSIEQLAKTRGYFVAEDTSISNAGWVVGVESPDLFLAAEAGITTSLVKTGVGCNLFKKMFPFSEILDL